MDGEEDWLFRPIRAGILPYLALKSTDYDLEDFVLANEALDVEQENQLRSARHQAALQAAQKKR